MKRERGVVDTHTHVRLDAGAEELGSPGDVGAGGPVKTGGRVTREDPTVTLTAREVRGTGTGEGVGGGGKASTAIEARGAVTRRNGALTLKTLYPRTRQRPRGSRVLKEGKIWEKINIKSSGESESVSLQTRYK